ncbi:hypothetical protein EXIGLDRAFT_474067 [Exidia glandulosa HHB12029]|uniref:Uncharacterized protein n=1 Tax=Exidia glandulosa HHB12029 TaxID=1314781 RepID=A0A165ARB5_EXIGL|nr:hypothetical protein EXIGLDRAFT_474067 [Exidia glandulosa HHB12029]
MCATRSCAATIYILHNLPPGLICTPNLALDLMDGSSSTATAPPSSPTETRNKQARKERMKNILEEGRNIATIMQGIAETNPVTKGCVVTFSTLITLEINRKENDEEIVKAVQRMIRMVEALSALTLPLMNDESLASRLQAVLAAMERKMEYFSASSE